MLHFTQTRETSAVIRPISHPGHARTKINIAAQLTVYSAKDVSNPDTWRAQTDSYSREAGVIDSVTRAPSRCTTIGTVCSILSRSRAAVNS